MIYCMIYELWVINHLWMVYFMMINGWFIVFNYHYQPLLTIINHDGYYPLMKWMIYGD